MKKLFKKLMITITSFSLLIPFTLSNVSAKEITPYYVWDYIHGYQTTAQVSTYSAWIGSNSYKFKVASNRNGTGSNIVFTGNITSRNKHLVYRLKEKIHTLGDAEKNFFRFSCFFRRYSSYGWYNRTIIATIC